MPTVTATPPSVAKRGLNIALLSDSLFFVRVVPVESSSGATEIDGQIELALESLAPFPLAQMYYGYYWTPGAAQAVVYAAYRKRFTSEQMDGWADAELVMPTFASLLAAQVEPATSIVLSTDEAITLLYWAGATAVPSAVLSKSLPPESTEGQRLAAREELLRSVDGSRKVIDVSGAPIPQAPHLAADFVFTTESLRSSFTREQLDRLDVRDKGELAARRGSRKRDLVLWRLFAGCGLALALALLLELSMLGARFWVKSQQVTITRQAPVVAEIVKAQMLSARIEELSTNRLRPIEMILLVIGEQQKPASVIFNRTTTSGVNKLVIEAETSRPADLPLYRSALQQLPQIAQVDVEQQETRNGISTFRLGVTFKPGALK